MARIYFLLCILGIVLPYGAFLPWLVDNGINVVAFFQSAIANPISIFAWLDVLVSAVVLLVFIVNDGQKNDVKYYWFAIIGTCSVGVSCGLPLYLFLKEVRSRKEL